MSCSATGNATSISFSGYSTTRTKVPRPADRKHSRGALERCAHRAGRIGQNVRGGNAVNGVEQKRLTEMPAEEVAGQLVLGSHFPGWLLAGGAFGCGGGGDAECAGGRGGRLRGRRAL